MTLRRWLAGLVGEISVWLQDKLWPPYTERMRRGLSIGWDQGTPGRPPWSRTDHFPPERMESRGWNN